MNKNLLYYEMHEKGITVAELCEYLGISRSSFYRKCNGKAEFSLTEVRKIVEYVKPRNASAIFFIPEVS